MSPENARPPLGRDAYTFRTCFPMHERVSTLRAYHVTRTDMHMHATGDIDEALLLPEEAASRLRVEPGTLAAWRSTGRQDLPYLKLGGHLVRYRASDVDKFISDAATRRK